MNCPLTSKACDKQCVFRAPNADEAAKGKTWVEGEKICRLVSLAISLEKHCQTEETATEDARNSVHN